MNKVCLAVMGMAWTIGAQLAFASFADRVVGYQAGTNSAVGYNNPASALGEPSRVTPGASGGPVDPFNPPFLPAQLVSIGKGGFLTVAFENPIWDAPGNPFGRDFIIFGNNGFTITNGDFSGGGVTDGSTFTFDPPGSSRVWVSEDGSLYYELVPPDGVMATVDGLYPTDGSGDFQRPTDPALTGADFAGLDLAGLRVRYGGSAGGTSFDLAWARTATGQNAGLGAVRYVRVEVSSGKVEVDGLAVVPEPAMPALLGLAGGLGLAGWAWRRWQRGPAGRAAQSAAAPPR